MLKRAVLVPVSGTCPTHASTALKVVSRTSGPSAALTSHLLSSPHPSQDRNPKSCACLSTQLPAESIGNICTLHSAPCTLHSAPCCSQATSVTAPRSVCCTLAPFVRPSMPAQSRELHQTCVWGQSRPPNTHQTGREALSFASASPPSLCSALLCSRSASPSPFTSPAELGIPPTPFAANPTTLASSSRATPGRRPVHVIPRDLPRFGFSKIYPYTTCIPHRTRLF